mgnify:CR=1 FL=1
MVQINKMKIYTKTGDSGTTSLYGGERLSKDSIFFDVLGENDELTSRIGYLCALINQVQPCTESPVILELHARLILILRDIQGNLQDINAIIAGASVLTEGKSKAKRLPKFTEDKVEHLEEFIDCIESYNPKLTKFILPGVTPIDAVSHMCRTQARKVERYIYRLHHATDVLYDHREGTRQSLDLNTIQILPTILSYNNRLSDFFFVVARWLCSHISGKEDVYK